VRVRRVRSLEVNSLDVAVAHKIEQM